jgi:hypothetical protein
MNGSDQIWEGSSPRVPVVISGEVAAQGVDAGNAPGVSGGDGVDDDARERMSKTMVSTSCLYACWGDEEWRLEWQ